MYLPNELINLIFSFRQPNPTALLIRESINIYNEIYKTTNANVFSSFYLHHLISHKKYSNHKKQILLREKYQEHFDDLKRRTLLFCTDGICRRTDNDDVVFTAYQNETKSYIDFTSYIGDLHHSIMCCDMINDDYFHRSIHGLYNHHTFYNKYRTEIYNHNKVMKPRILPKTSCIFSDMMNDLDILI